MITKFQLKNKMEVLMVESRKSPVVSVQMWVHNGSADERKGEEGISHFIEHLVFKGTKKYKVGEIAKTVEGSGGELNAYTSFDQTVFYVTISSQFSDVALSVINEMMMHPKFDPQEIENEKEVVIEEIKRSNDSPHRQASRLLFEGFYKKHPYGIPVIGYDENIRNMTAKQIVSYYESRYIPSNMKLVVVGDFNSQEMKKKIVEQFDLPVKRKLRVAKRTVEKKKTKNEIIVKPSAFKETFVYMVWPLPNGFHKDIPALDVLAMILGHGESSRLMRSIKMEQHLVNSVGASSYTPKEPGLFGISATMNGENAEAYLTEVKKELLQFLNEGPTQEEMSRAILNVESEKYYSLETVDGVANLYGHFDFFFGDYRKFNDMMKKMSSVTSSDVLRVAKKYLQPQLMQVFAMTDKDSSKMTKAIEAFTANLKKEVRAVKSKKLKTLKSKHKKMTWKAPKIAEAGQVEKITLKNGIRLLIREQSDSPALQIKSAFLGGLRLEDPKQAGVNELLSRVWTSGTKSLTEAEISARLESSAASVSAFGGRNSLGVSMTCLQAFADETFELFCDVVKNPVFETQAIEREKSLMLESLRNREDNPAQKCMLNMSREMFGTHPYGRDPLGQKETVQALNQKTVQDYYNRILVPENFVISLVGPVKTSDWVKKIKSAFESMPAKKLEAPPIEKPKLLSNRKASETTQKEQTHIALVYPSISLLDPRRYALEVMQSILSGQGGRLFIELRDKASLAYTVAPLRLDGLDAGYFGAYIGCSPEKSDKAIAMMRAELSRLKEEKVGGSELESAKRYLAGRYAIGNQKGSQLASLALFDELYGLPFNEHLEYSERVMAVTADDIKKLANEIFSQNEVLSIVGRA
jgi:zinc protease